MPGFGAYELCDLGGSYFNPPKPLFSICNRGLTLLLTSEECCEDQIKLYLQSAWHMVVLTGTQNLFQAMVGS